MSQFGEWNNFYVIVGSAAGALIGLQFVVMTLIAQRQTSVSAEAGAAFTSPTVVHFSAALFLAALLVAPWQTTNVPAIIWGATGFCGVLYSVMNTRRMRRQNTYKPAFEDWLFHVILPVFAYATLTFSPFALVYFARESLFAIGSAALLLLFVGIHNSWDNVAYHVLEKPNTSANQNDKK